MFLNFSKSARTSFPAKVDLATAVKAALTVLLLVTVVACGSDDDDSGGDAGGDTTGDTGGDTTGDTDGNGGDNAASSGPDGQISFVSPAGVTETISAIESVLDMNPAITVVGSVDHQANAEAAGLELGPNEVILFGNPLLGTPLMQQNQQTGIDLPQKLHAFENDAGEVVLTYNGASYLQQRHGLDVDTAQLATISGALGGIAAGVSGVSVDDAVSGTSSVTAGEGIVVVESTRPMTETYDALVSAIEGTGTLEIFRQINHSENATGVNLELRPTRLVIFGTPNVGTPLMVSQPSIGIDLPLKALVYEDAEQNVFIAYNDPAYLAERHGITDQDMRLGNIAGNLAGFAAAAAGN